MKERIIKCKVCGKTKVTKCFWAKYCSPKCRSIGWADEAKKDMGVIK
jgi:hypothetical protein